ERDDPQHEHDDHADDDPGDDGGGHGKRLLGRRRFMAGLNLWRGRGEGKRRNPCAVRGTRRRANRWLERAVRGAIGAKRTSLPGLTRQSIHLRKDFFAKEMDARVKPAHDSWERLLI